MRRLSKREILQRGYHLLLRRPNPDRILWLTLGITYRCNGQCLMCSIWKRYREQPELVQQEMQVEEYRMFFQSPLMTHLQGIALTGGEPFLREDLTQIVGAAIAFHPDAILSIASNGLLPERIDRATAEILKWEPHGLSISLSLDGGRELHNRIRGMADAFDRLMETVNRLQRYDVNLGFNFTITPENWRAIAEAEDISVSLGIPMLVNFAHESSHYYDNQDLSPIPEEYLDQIHILLQKIAKHRQRNETLTQRVLDPYPYFLMDCTRFQRIKQQLVPCHSGSHSLYLDPLGTVYPCIIRDSPLGNIRDQNFTEIWTSDQARQVRRSISSGACHCWVACEAVPSVLRGLQSVTWNLKTLRGG